MQKTCLVITGPTATGKTPLAIQLALHYHTSIISADSRQCYREMTIGVAKPSPAELEQVRHYFINSHSVKEEVNAAVFEEYALASAREVFLHKDLVILVGGTGLYIKAFCEGLDDIPDVSPELRGQINEQYEKNGLSWLQEQVQQIDPLYFATGEIQNPRRLIRALEVKKATGISIRNFQRNKKADREFRIIKAGLQWPVADLRRNIDVRVENMMEQGLMEEVKELVTWQHLPALQTVGYKELFGHLQGLCTLPEAIELIKKNTRQYAKRQMTWFRKDPSIKWFSPSSASEIIDYYQSALHFTN